MANLPVAEMTADQETRLRSLATEAYTNWKSKATEEIRAAGLAELERFKTDANYATERLTKFAEMFQAADADGNGRLDRAEFAVLMEKVHEEAKAKGQFVEPIPEHQDRIYELYNEIAGGEEGFTYENQLAFSGKMMAMYGELKAADEGA